MATGAGKTVVMAMLIAWQALNKLANAKDPRFSDAFLIVAPGITIRDRLRVLLPTDPNNYYRQRDVVPSYLLEELGKAKIVITNFHGFQLRETVQAARLTKSILGQGDGRIHRDARPDGAARAARTGQQEEHYRAQRRGAPLLRPAPRSR
jgi:type III restriction enzyme